VISYTETPIQNIHSPLLDKAGLRLYIKREDMNHPSVSGNKWWKLKYNLSRALECGAKKLLTFGGAYSNLIYATAAAAKECGLESVGIIRGEEHLPLNPILSFAKSQGMQLRYVSREEYARKSEPKFLENLATEFGEFYLIPEGGTNQQAIKGCAEWGAILARQEFDYLCLPVGTGGTIAGIVIGLAGKRKIVGYSVLKGGEFLTEEVKKLVFDFGSAQFFNWEIETGYHFGGYAKLDKPLYDFIATINRDNNLPLDPVYTAKMVFGIFDGVRNNKFENGSTLLAIHTGGIH
jgi:1-aminocyclopropane-1-carboxylate deaminase